MVDDISSINPRQKYIKAHMKNGEVYILHDWLFDKDLNALFGSGVLLDINRRKVESAKMSNPRVGEKFSVPIDEISLIETNEVGYSLAGGLVFINGVSAAIGLYCIGNPKACFGSCPTFYAHSGDSLKLQAEGFSASIAPSLERNDIDMLYDVNTATDFELMVTNEALETHSIRYARILAFPRGPDERVFATPGGKFFRCDHFTAPAVVRSETGLCTDLLNSVDAQEYYSLADAHDLSTKESLYVEFENEVDAKTGLVVGKRQTLLTTFLMYQGLAYMGNSVGYWLSELERGKLKKKITIFDQLGKIKVYLKDSSGAWKYQGEVGETGPIATDFNIIPISADKGKKIELKLVMNKGLWRIDYLAIASMNEEVIPRVIEPSSVETLSGNEMNPYDALLDPRKHLVTYPGHAYKIKYRLPFVEAELFLDSKGYYLEWIRDAWIKEQDFRMLNLFMNKPRKYLKMASNRYKHIEPTMEETFWNSRYVEH